MATTLPSGAPSEVLPLPDLSPDQTGTSVAAAQSAKGSFKAEVTNKSGYMCHIALECTFKVPPQVVFGIFTHPDNSDVFRDIKGVGSRKVISEQPGYKVVEVEQDVLSRFAGEWELRPVLDAKTGHVVACDATLRQDVLPKGMPPFLSRLPVLGGLLRRVSLGTIRRLVEDVFYICERFEAAGPAATLDDVMNAISRERAPKDGTRPPSAGVSPQPGQPVRSFAVEGSDLGTEEEEEEEEEHAHKHASQAATAHAGSAPADASKGPSTGTTAASSPPHSPDPKQVEAAVTALERAGFS